MAKASNLTKFTAFRNEDEAIALLELMRWPNGAACPHCGGADPYRLTSERLPRAGPQGPLEVPRLPQAVHGQGGHDLRGVPRPASKWLMALHLIARVKKGMSAHQLHRMLGVTYRAAWFMAHRLRHAMSDPIMFQLSGMSKRTKRMSAASAAR